MACDTALQIVSKELKVAEESGCEVFHATFMGGEPFLNFDVIKSVVGWMQGQTTNGNDASRRKTRPHIRTSCARRIL